MDFSKLSLSGTMNPGIATFEMEYRHWVDEQNKQVTELRKALQDHITGDTVLQYLVDNSIRHYLNLLDMKATAAKANVCYLISGVWRTAAEHCFSWIGGHRPSELLTVLIPHLEALTDQQLLEIRNLKASCQHAEEALSMGMERLHRIIMETVASGVGLGRGNHLPRIHVAIEKLDALVRFVNQADHLRREALMQMSRILSLRQTAHGLVALGEYYQGLRTVSSLWTSRPRPRV